MAKEPIPTIRAHPFRGKARRAAGLSLMAGVGALLLLIPSRAQDKPAAPAAKAGEYAGSEVCMGCHEDIAKAFQKNPHSVLDKFAKRGWQGKVCESCHGPGAKHAESVSADDIANPGKLAAAKADQKCLSCHLNQSTVAGRIQGGHARNQVSCAGCHSMHRERVEGAPAGLALRKPAAINELCSGCHSSEWAQFQRPHRHRLPENAMSCVDCHNPHGSFLPASIRTASANEPGCFRCHGDKRGPFVYEHAPVRLEGCVTCHEPHGSANPRMLTRREVTQQCLECHANIATPVASELGGIPPAFHDLRSARFRNCTICHVKIHGSQVNRALLR